MFSNMLVLTCFALVICIDAKAHNKITSSPDKITFLDSSELIKNQQISPVSKSNVKDRTPPVLIRVVDSSKDKMPAIDNRVAIQVGSCPVGYVRMGGFCVPSDYDWYYTVLKQDMFYIEGLEIINLSVEVNQKKKLELIPLLCFKLNHVL